MPGEWRVKSSFLGGWAKIPQGRCHLLYVIKDEFYFNTLGRRVSQQGAICGKCEEAVPSGCVCVLSHSVVSYSLRPYGLHPTRLLCAWNFPVKNTGMNCHFLLQGSNPSFLYLAHWQADSLPLSDIESPFFRLQRPIGAKHQHIRWGSIWNHHFCRLIKEGQCEQFQPKT